MELAQLSCPTCKAAIPGEAVHLELSLARCPGCKVVFDLRQRLGPAAPTWPKPRAQVPLPASFEVDERPGEGITVRWRWIDRTAVVMGLVMVIADAVLMVWLPDAWRTKHGLEALIPLIAVGVCAFFSYGTVALLLNRTELRASREGLRIRHGPLPWRGNAVIDRQDISQLYCVEHVAASRDNRYVYYSLNALDRDGRKRTLLKEMDGLDRVLWLEQAIERHLEIENVPVAGEVARQRA